MLGQHSVQSRAKQRRSDMTPLVALPMRACLFQRLEWESKIKPLTEKDYRPIRQNIASPSLGPTFIRRNLPSSTEPARQCSVVQRLGTVWAVLNLEADLPIGEDERCLVFRVVGLRDQGGREQRRKGCVLLRRRACRRFRGWRRERCGGYVVPGRWPCVEVFFPSALGLRRSRQ